MLDSVPSEPSASPPTPTASDSPLTTPRGVELIDSAAAVRIARDFFMEDMVGGSTQVTVHQLRVLSVHPSLADVHGRSGWTVAMSGIVTLPGTGTTSATMWLLVDADSAEVTILSLADGPIYDPGPLI